ncbi:MAG: Fe-S cluster assembly protein SufD [Candidatus Methylacidiphilales bacterium]
MSTSSIPLNQGPGAVRKVGHWPQWWTDAADEAWDLYQKMPMPSRKNEEWRFASIQNLSLEEAVLPGSAHPPLEELPELGIPGAIRAQCVHSTCRFQDLPREWSEKGVLWLPLNEAAHQHPDLLKKHFMHHEASLENRKFALLHRAFVETGAVLYLPARVRIDQPFVCEYWLDGPHASIFPHTLIIAEEGASVTWIDSFRSTGNQPGYASAYTEIHAGAGSEVSYLCTQEWNEKVLSFQHGVTHVHRDASTKVFHFNSGGRYARLETVGRALGSGARSEMLGLSLAHGTQELDQRTLQMHEAPHTWSNLLFKNALNHRGKTIFSGLIKVFPGARQTDAYQTNRNLLLDSNAEADSMPGLEILNDDVKCSHGATTSQVEEESLFYMLARGINPEAAKHLIAVGFCEELLECFGHADISALLSRKIAEKFRASEKLDPMPNLSDGEVQETTSIQPGELQGTH